MLLPILAAAALAVTPSLESGLVFWDDYTAPRSATVSAAGAKVVRIHARAGWLKVRGRDGAANVKATGTARASNESWLPEIKLTAERSGDVIDVTVDIPERSFVGVGRFYRALDLEVELPANVAIEIEDSSGDLEVRDVAALDVEDSSGDIALANIGGALRVRDSSGEIRVDGVRGDVQLRDSSGDWDDAYTGVVQFAVIGE